jgi:wyosine [tRNA(Phe)-imidazoG37] synthetase (radical SAM superfamily)
LFNDIEKSWTETLALWITGEPFLHPDIKFILDKLKNINIKQWFLTNWYKLLENIEFLIQNKHIEHLYINISSWNLKSFQATRKWDNFLNFLNTWNAINILREKRPNIIIRCLYVITPQNLNWIEDFIKLSVKNNINEIELKRVVPYDFSEDKLNFSDIEIKKVLTIIKKSQNYLKENKITINENFDYIINDFKKIIIWIQAPESSKINKNMIEWLTNNCYNPYFYLSILRNDSYSCWKFIWKIWKLSDFNLYNLLFEKKEIKNIILWTENLRKFLWENTWREKCSRCHHMDVNNMVSNYLKIKQILINLKKWTE